MIGTIIGALFPVFALIALGYWSGKVQLLGEAGEPVLTRFVGQVTLPVLTFVTLATMKPADLAVPAMVGVVLGGSALVYVVTFAAERLLHTPAGEANISALVGGYGNSAFVGLPVCLVVLGQASLGPAAVVIALNASIVFGWAVLVDEMLRHRRGGLLAGLGRSLRQIGTNPLIVSAVAGVAAALAGLRLPVPLLTTLQTLGGATAACALVAIGMFMARPFERVQPAVSLRLMLAKLVLHPLAAFGLLELFPPMPPIWNATAILMAAMPTGASAYVVAVQAGERASRIAATVIVLTTLAAMLSLPIVLFLLERVGMVSLGGN
ncbi:MAG: AEC family transporter [Sphingomonadaceae bacterium]|nr:AEC family transporter [Sphingomonadaceae bacterium]